MHRLSGIKRKRILLKPFEFIKKTIFFIFFPSKCKICKNDLNFNEHIICNECIRNIHANTIDSQNFLSSSSNIFFLFKFENEVRELIHIYKYDKIKPLAKTIAMHISEFLILNGLTYDYLVPIPSHRNRIKERGFDHIKHILKFVSSSTKTKVLDLFIKAKDTKKQALLSTKEREKNIKNSIVISEKIPRRLLENKKILIVDDVYTTGATIGETYKVIKNSNLNLKSYDFLLFSKRE